MTSANRSQRKHRGEVERLPSGSIRVRVYAGKDPVSGKRHRLEEIVPAGPHAEADAEKALTRLLAQRDEQRNARTRATVNQLLDKYFDLMNVQETTKENYKTLARLHIRPLLGTVPLSKIKVEQVRQLRSYSLVPSVRAELARLLAELGALAGWEALDQYAIGQAWEHHELAKRAAREADSAGLLAHATAHRRLYLPT